MPVKLSLSPFINPLNWFKAWLYNRKNVGHKRSARDPELYLYSRILRNDMLHYGYFSNPDVAPDTLSIKDVEDAQVQYAQNIIDQLGQKAETVLDVGCGMGGLAVMLRNQGYRPEALTPDQNQANYIRDQYSELPCYHTKFEKFEGDKAYEAIVHSESVQYIKLKEAFDQVDKLLKENGRWIVVDYFRTHKDAKNKSGHLLEDFKAMARDRNWQIITEQDITPNVLPTLRFINMYAQRFLLPVKDFAFEKLRLKKGWLYYLLGDLRESVDKKLHKELAAVDPEQFERDKRYLLMVLERGG